MFRVKAILLGIAILTLSACSSMNNPNPGHSTSTSWTDDMPGTSDTSSSEESFSSKMLKSNDTSKWQQMY